MSIENNIGPSDTLSDQAKIEAEKHRIAKEKAEKLFLLIGGSAIITAFARGCYNASNLPEKLSELSRAVSETLR